MPFGWLKRLWGGAGGHPALVEPFPQGWEGILRRNVRHDALLAEAERAKLREDLRVFVAGKHWEGCGMRKGRVESMFSRRVARK